MFAAGNGNDLKQSPKTRNYFSRMSWLGFVSFGISHLIVCEQPAQAVFRILTRCRRLLRQPMRLPFSLALLKAGNSIAARIAMMAMTTSNSRV